MAIRSTHAKQQQCFNLTRMHPSTLLWPITVEGTNSGKSGTHNTRGGPGAAVC